MTKTRKGLIIIIDGLGDRPHDLLGNATPLDAAHTPNLDHLVSRGLCGLVDPFIPGYPVGTHTGTSPLMGVPPSEVAKLARGPIEARGINAPIDAGDIALRGNFATLKRRENNGFEILDRRAGRIRDATTDLTQALQGIDLGNDMIANVYPATHHRVVVHLSGPWMSEHISDTDPGDLGISRGALISKPSNPDSKTSVATANALNRFTERAFEILSVHPVNRDRLQQGLLPATGIIARGAGKLRELHSILRALELSVAVISGERTILGLANILGYNTITQPEFTALPDTNLDAKVDAAMRALLDHDLVYLHIKGTDTCGHDRNSRGKMEFIERIDRAILPLINDHTVIGVTADHSTDSGVGRHCGDPVPSLIFAPGGRRDDCRAFGESKCMKGGLGRINSQTFLYSVLDSMDALHNYSPHYINDLT